MATPTLEQVCDGIAATLGAATGIVRTQSFDELTETYQDLPLLQVYPSEGETDAFSGANDRTAFGAGARVSEWTIRADVICRQRSHLDEDMAKCVTMQAAVEAKLLEQRGKPLFGVPRIQGFRWRWEIVALQQGGESSTMWYMAVRFHVAVRLF